jgi:hypothetical protein
MESAMWNEQYKTLLPPIDTVFNLTAANVVFGVCLVLVTGVLLCGLRHWRNTGSPIVLMILLGGLTTVLAEPFLDTIGAAWHPTHGQNTAFEMMGRRIPWWVVINYPAYFGVLVSANYLAFAKGITMRGVWLWFLVPLAADAIQEELMMMTNLYYYYGQQPLILIHKLPFWWVPCNAMGVFLIASVLAFMGSSLRGWKLLLVPAIMPVTYVTAFAIVGLPSIISIHTMNVPGFISNLAGLSAFVLAGLVVYGIAHVLGTDSPWKREAAAV